METDLHASAISATRCATPRIVTAHWHAASKAAGLCIEEVIEPQLNAADILADQRFDPRALEVPWPLFSE